jgi:serine/threonine protein kinase
MSPEQSIAHNRIISKLGEGGMGAVYRGADTKLNRDVAIKILRPELAVLAEETGVRRVREGVRSQESGVRSQESE